MRNSFLLFLLWIFSMGIALFSSNDPSFANTAWWLPFWIISYIFYYCSASMSLGMIALFIAIASVYSNRTDELSLFLPLLYFAILLFKRKSLRPSLFKKTAWAFFCIGFFFAYIQRHSLNPNTSLQWLVNASYLCFNFGFFICVWWFLQVPGAIFEESIFPNQVGGKQLDLFTVRQAKISGKLYPMKLQKRIRRRFGLKDGW